MQLVQTSMFGFNPEVIVPHSTAAEQVLEAPKVFDMDAWHKSIGGQWEEFVAEQKALAAANQAVNGGAK